MKATWFIDVQNFEFWRLQSNSPSRHNRTPPVISIRVGPLRVYTLVVVEMKMEAERWGGLHKGISKGILTDTQRLAWQSIPVMHFIKLIFENAASQVYVEPNMVSTYMANVCHTLGDKPPKRCSSFQIADSRQWSPGLLVILNQNISGEQRSCQ